MKIDIKLAKTGEKLLQAKAAEFPKRLKQASARAINDTAFDIKNMDLPKQAKKDFDRPMPHTAKRSWRVLKARPTSMTPTGYIYVAPTQAKYLEVQIKGGVRTEDHPVPLRDAKLNQYGNMPRGHLKRKGTFARKFKGKRYVFRELKSKIELVAIWPKRRRYRKRFNYKKAVENGVKTHFRYHYKKHLNWRFK